MAGNLILAYDFGTSGVKACVFDRNCRFLASAYDTYPTEYPQEGYAVHNPLLWWDAMGTATRKVMGEPGVRPEEICAISFSSHGGAVVPVDKNGTLLMDRVMVWNDARCREEADDILRTVGEQEHYRRTGNSMDLSMSMSAKLLWLRRHLPEVYRNTYKFLGAKEYIIYRMTGIMGLTDYAEVSTSGAYNLQAGDWDPELVELCQLDVEKLCRGADPTTYVGGLTPQAAGQLGLCQDIPVILGSWDNYACATGGGVQEKGRMVVCMGTAGWMGLNHSAPIMLPECKINVVRVGEHTYFTSIHTHSACAAYDWVRANMCRKDGEPISPEEAEKMAEQVPAGSEKLFFLPSMFTGNTFYSSSALCGTFVGLKMMQGTAHLLRAAMEGPAFDLMMGAQLLKERGLMANTCHLIGGGAKSNLWRQILADMFGVPMVRPKYPQHIGALGAALFAGTGVGVIQQYDTAAPVHSGRAAVPDQARTRVYQSLLPVYRQCYEALMPVYKELQAAAR